MVDFPTQIPDGDSHSPALLHLYIYFLLYLLTLVYICSAMAFSLLGNSDHVAVSIFIDFPINSKRDSPFHRIAYDHSRAD